MRVAIWQDRPGAWNWDIITGSWYSGEYEDIASSDHHYDTREEALDAGLAWVRPYAELQGRIDKALADIADPMGAIGRIDWRGEA